MVEWNQFTYNLNGKNTPLTDAAFEGKIIINLGPLE